MSKKIRNNNEVWKTDVETSVRQASSRIVNRSVRCKITKVYHPGDENPEGFEHLNDNIIRVEVEATDPAFKSYNSDIKGWVFPLQADPILVGWVMGNTGLEEKEAVINFTLPNIKTTGLVFLDGQNILSFKKDKESNKKYLKQKKFNLTSMLLGN